MSLEGTALVTGGAKRIGAHITEALAARGADIVIHHHTSGAEADDLARDVRDHGARAWTLQADLADPSAGASLVARASELSGGPVRYLVNNASIYPRDTMADATWENLDQNVRVNAWSPFAAMRGLAAQTEDGAVVNLLDTRLADLDRTHLSYHFSKAMLAAMTDAGARLLAPDVRVNGVAPGPVLAPVGTDDDDFLARIAKLMPLQRTPSPAEIADAVRWLLESRSVTGQVIAVDAGRHLGRAIEG